MMMIAYVCIYYGRLREMKKKTKKEREKGATYSS
jgi:hypothetical protein